MARKSLMTTAKRVSTIGPAHDGGPKRGFLAKAGEPALARHSGPNISTNAKRPKTGNIARDGKAKAHLDVPLHNSATGRQIAGSGKGGLSHAASGGDNAAPGAHPFDSKAPLPKTAGGPMQVTRGNKCRPGSNLSDPNAVLGEAVKSGGRC